MRALFHGLIFKAGILKADIDDAWRGSACCWRQMGVDSAGSLISRTVELEDAGQCHLRDFLRLRFVTVLHRYNCLCFISASVELMDSGYFLNGYCKSEAKETKRSFTTNGR